MQLVSRCTLFLRLSLKLSANPQSIELCISCCLLLFVTFSQRLSFSLSIFYKLSLNALCFSVYYIVMQTLNRFYLTV